MKLKPLPVTLAKKLLLQPRMARSMCFTPMILKTKASGKNDYKGLNGFLMEYQVKQGL